MEKKVECPCGATMQGETDDELVTNVEAHVRDKHPDMAAEMTRDKILADGLGGIVALEGARVGLELMLRCLW